MPDPTDRLNAALEGRYAIDRELGEGGMATVYLAEDLKHERKVALKVLKPELAAVVGAERFLAEIKTTANLQHPHILPLHDSGEADGFLYYVMPYVEGETLRARIEHEKQLPVTEAVRIATGVANALHHAHERGVVHRDIKPANILIQDGEPVVADFGIALAVGAAGGSRLTETGLSVGTPYYMSPEQATGDQSIGPASDVYALACVLYEMLVGEPPYIGNTAQAVLGKIIQGDAVPAINVRQAVPLNVDAALRRSLEKLPADRFAAAAEFARALNEPSFRHGAAVQAVEVAAHTAGRWKAVAAAFAVLAGGALGWDLLWPEPAPPVSRQRVLLFDWDALAETNQIVGSVRYGVAIAPDGSALIVRDPVADELLIKERGALDPVPISGTEGGFAPVFSPDGEWVAFVTGDFTLRKVPRRGGSPITLADETAVREQQIAWLDDGRVVFNSAGWHLDAVGEDGGSRERLLDVGGIGRFVTGVTSLPGSPGVLFGSCDASCPNPELRVLDFRTGEERTLMPGVTGGWYLRSGHLLFVREEGSVFVAPFDVGTLEITGPEIPILESISTTPRRADLAATWDGTVVYLPGQGFVAAGVEPVWVDMAGEATPVELGWYGAISEPLLSPDDDFVAYVEGGGADAEVRVRELPGGPTTSITVNDFTDFRPRWSSDGRSVLYLSFPEADRGFVSSRRADAGQPAEVFLEPDDGVDLRQIEVSADGSWIIYRLGSGVVTAFGDRGANSGGADLWVRHAHPDSAARPLLASDSNDGTPTLSPDGRWIAYTSAESGRAEVIVRPFPDVGAARHQISVAGGNTPLWAPNGDALYYYQAGVNLMIEARLQTEPAFDVLERTTLFNVTGYQVGPDHWQYDLNRDGSRFFMLRQSGTTAEGALEASSGGHVLVENFLQEVAARVRN